MNKEFNEFKSEVMAALSKEGLLVTAVNVEKNNGVKMHGINIRRDADDIVSPNIYLDNYYEKYQEGESVESITGMIKEVFEEHSLAGDLSSVTKFFFDWEQVRKSVFCQVIGKNTNQELLKDTPCRDVAGTKDITMVFRVAVPEFIAGSTASILIKNSHLGNWDVTVNDLYDAAKENTPRLFPACTSKMSDILRESMSSQGLPDFMIDEMLGDMENQQPAMYVITNEQRMYGATTAIAFAENLRNLADQLDSDLIILPSSIHEVIAIPMKGSDDSLENDPDALLRMVDEVNTTQVAPEEVLTTNVYVFSRENGFSELKAA